MKRLCTLSVLCVALVFAGCGSDETPESGVSSANQSDSGGQGDGVLLGDTEADAGPVVAGPEDRGVQDTGPQDSGEQDIGTDSGDAGSDFEQIPCKDSTQCPSGVCLMTPNGKMCANTCSGGCPAEYKCVEVLHGQDVSYVCAHQSPFRCRTCATDKDCAADQGGNGKAGKCVDIGGGGFCLQGCDKGQACVGDGFSCAKVSAGGKACVPKGGVCPCPDGVTGHCKLSNPLGTCPGTFTCSGNKPGVCQGDAPVAEICNGKDDDCDGEVDEEVNATSCDIKNVYGTCKGTTLCIGGTLLCQGASAAPEVCNGIDDNCSDSVDEGFADTDKDGKADCVDSDDDDDGIADTTDNCPLVANVTQTDSDGDKLGDKCDPDWDGDGVGNAPDNCPWQANPKQEDLDGDGTGDACDCDLDGDKVPNAGKDKDAVACPKAATMDSCPADKNPGQEDLDKDGRGDACDPDIDGDGDPNITDCKDDDPAIHHKATELCNGKDDDCDGQVDEAGATGCKNYYVDGDGDGWGVSAFLCLCKPKGLYTADTTGDCNDKDKAIRPEAQEICHNGKDDYCNGSVDEQDAKGCTDFYFDGDTDGYGTKQKRCFCAPSGDYTAKKQGDCDDKAPAVNPAQNEKCGDNTDNNCNGHIDEAGCQGCLTMYEDQDNDGYGVAGSTQCLGAPKFPYNAPVAGDCNDKDANVKPGALETCNGKDDNCDTLVDPAGTLGCQGFYPDVDKDGWGDKVAPVCLCKATTATSVNKTGDCNDNSAKSAPGKPEVCDGEDNNCNGQADEGVKTTFYKDNDGDGYGSGAPIQACTVPSKGYAKQDGDCNDFNKAIHPGAKEACNKADDDCNGLIDDGLTLVNIYADVDGDGFGGKNAKAAKHCLFDGKTPPLGYALSHDDCDDSKSTVYPGAPELCDGILNNCKQAAKDAHCPKKCEGKWPVFIGGGSGFAAIAQLDGDNELEVVARGPGNVFALDKDGSIKWKTAGGVSYSYPSLADMNGDATVDVVSPQHGGSVAILNGSDGKVLTTLSGTNAAGYYGAAVFDVDADGVPDIIPTGSGSARLLLMNSNLTIKKNVALNPTSSGFFLANFAVIDLAGDGIPELFAATGSWGCSAKPETCKGRLFGFDVGGAIINDPLGKSATKPHFAIAGYPKAYGGEGQWPIVVDIDGDGATELHQPMSGSSTRLWSKDGKVHALNAKAGISGFPQVAPIDADWQLDTSGKVRAVGGAIVDIDGDGDYEQIGSGAGGLVVRKQGKVMDGYPVKLSTGPVVVGDINRDGQLDVLFLSGSNNSVNCYTLGADTWSDTRMLHPGATNGLGRSHYPTNSYDPFEPNDVRGKPFVAKTSKNPLKDSRAFRISALREVYASGGGWTHKLQAVLGDKGDVDHYVLYGGIIHVTLAGLVRDYDLHVHAFKGDGTFLQTRSSTNKGTAGESINCHSTNLCPAGTAYFIIEVRGKDPTKDYGPWPYRLYTNWAQ